jgi:pimeloyl-ACP methyl ester carboxylesterase
VNSAPAPALGICLHGEAFGCYYFRNVIEALTGAGYRVVAPDQIGWGKSPKPDIHYSFQLVMEDPLGQYAQPAEAARLGDFTALSAAAARDIPRATRVVIPDCGHIPHLEHPGQFLAELLPFLAS